MQTLYEVGLELDENTEYQLTYVPNEEYSLVSVQEEDSNYTLELDDDSAFNLEIQDKDIFDFIIESSSAFINYIDGDVYDGPYTVTPSRQSQILNTANCVLLDNIVVNAIPSNYGLITWDGNTLTIS